MLNADLSGFKNLIGLYKIVNPLFTTIFLYKVALKTVTIDNTTINFDNGIESTKFYPTKSNTYNQLQLNNIAIKHNNIQTKNIQFQYQYQNSWRFLKKLIVGGIEEFTFDYSLSYTLPDPLTQSLDNWGFWRGGYELTFPITINDVSTQNIYNRKSTVTQFCDVTLLKKITYPTGGYSMIYYEPNQYGKIVRRFERNRTEARISNASGYAGGARVAKIEDYDNKGGVMKKEYKYVLNYPNNSSSSGISTTDPVYYATAIAIAPPIFVLVGFITVNSFQCNFNAGQNHIAYSNVTEVRSDNSYTKFKFSSDIDLPNRGSEKTELKNNSDFLPSDSQFPQFPTDFSFFGFGYVEDNFYKGKLLSKTDFNANNEKVKSLTYNYNFNSKLSRYVAAMSVNMMGMQSYKICTMPCRVINEVDTTFESSSKFLVRKINYQYNDFDLLELTTTTNSDGKTQKNEYRYINDVIKVINNSSYSAIPFNDMKTKNMIGVPIETINYVREADNQDKVINVDAITFQKTSDNLIVPYLAYKLHIENPISNYNPIQITHSHYWRMEATQFSEKKHL